MEFLPSNQRWLVSLWDTRNLFVFAGRVLSCGSLGWFPYYNRLEWSIEVDSTDGLDPQTQDGFISGVNRMWLIENDPNV